MGVCTDHKTTGESVVLEGDLVDDTGARLPETETVGGSGSKEVLVDVDGALEILGTADLSLNQVVAVDGGGNSGSVHAS